MRVIGTVLTTLIIYNTRLERSSGYVYSAQSLPARLGLSSMPFSPSLCVVSTRRTWIDIESEQKIHFLAEHQSRKVEV